MLWRRAAKHDTGSAKQEGGVDDNEITPNILLLSTILCSLSARSIVHSDIATMSLWWGSDPFAELVGKATSELLPAGQEDIALNLEICDKVRAKQVPPKQAMQVIKKRINDNNPNVVLLALGLTDICIKNGGDHFLAEVASHEFMDNLVSLLKKPTGVNHDVSAKALKLIQNWAQIAEAKPGQMGYIDVIYRSLKASGADFPPPDASGAASAAFVETLTAPEWVDGDVCMRCRTAFSTFNRKHHCRNCGNVFCQQCSSHNMSLPWYGVGQDVRVCDGCFAKKAPPSNPASATSAVNKLQRSSTSIAPTGRGGLAAQRSAALGSKPSSSSRRSKREEDDLALAISLSLQDAGSSGSAQASGSAPSEPPTQRATRQPNGRMLEGTDADDDPDLAAAIAASLKEYVPPQPSAPWTAGSPPVSPSIHPSAATGPASSTQESALPLPPSLDLPPKDVDALLTFAQTVRQQNHQASQYGSVGAPSHQSQALYDQATAARPKVARSLDEAGRRHGVLMSMHDKLTEAVRLYDRLLDAQLSRPAHGYSHPQQQYHQPYQPQQQAPGSPDPFPRQHYLSHPHQYAAQPPLQYQDQQRYASGSHNPDQQQAYAYFPHAQPPQTYSQPAGPDASMYPTLPSSQPTALQQIPQQTGSSVQAASHSSGPYLDSAQHPMSPQPGISMTASFSQPGVAPQSEGVSHANSAEHSQYYSSQVASSPAVYAPHQQQPGADAYYSQPSGPARDSTYHASHQAYPEGDRSQSQYGQDAYYQHPQGVQQPNGQLSQAEGQGYPSAVEAQSDAPQSPAALHKFEKLMSPGQNPPASYAQGGTEQPHEYQDYAPHATSKVEETTRAGVGAHGKTAAATTPPVVQQSNGHVQPAPVFPQVPASDFPSQPTNAQYPKQQQAEAPALIEL